MQEEKYISIPQLARVLDISRVAVFKKVKSGEIPSVKIGRNYAIPEAFVLKNRDTLVKRKNKKGRAATIVEAANKAFDQFQETFKRLGNE